MTSTRGLDETELRLRTLRESGFGPVDRNGRLRVPLGSGPESDRVQATYEIQERRVHRESRVLSNAEFERLYRGVAVANLEGLILNTFVTISWSLAGLDAPSSVREAQAKFQERMTSWFFDHADRGRRLPRYAGVWVKEVGRTMGLHSHYLLHVPQGYSALFGRWVRKSIARATESSLGPIRRGARGHPLYVTHVADLNFSVGAQWNVLRYMAKGLDADGLTSVFSASRRRMLAAEYTGLSKLSDEGVVVGQRCGRSRAISDAALAPWQHVYDDVMGAEWRSAGRKSFHYGPAFLARGELGRQLEGLGV